MSEDMQHRNVQLSIPVDAALKAKLEAAAEREDRPLASYVRRLVTKAFNEEARGAAA